jgi:hypothetical protein
MAGYLDAYGVADERRERLIKRIVLWGLSVIVAAAILYFGFRTRGQERVMSQFLEDLGRQQYQDAYKLWGCPENSKASSFKIEHVDYCDEGVVFDLSYPNSGDDIGLWVNRSTNVISFNPTPRCPGRHMQLGAFFRSLFS